MIFLSAQPDEIYFIWQLELQLHNFHSLGLAPEDIQVLIGYDPKMGLSKEFSNFITGNTQAQFFVYEDTRELTFYPSSLRPHIIKKHLKSFPALENRPIFYHDSDIIFRTVPNFECMLLGDNWYLSDASSYLDSGYIKSKGENVFKHMCQIVDIDESLVLANDQNTDGAQYLIKSANYVFWDKVEKDCNQLYFILNIYEQLNGKIGGLDPKDKVPIQAWCSDMWALLWNAWKFGFITKIHKELDFCWPQQSLGIWNQVKIYHDSCITEDQQHKFFCKSLYKKRKPFQDDFSNLSKNACSFKYVENMQSYVNSSLVE
nr:hypothetical protein [Pedobacter panaciterrae]